MKTIYFIFFLIISFTAYSQQDNFYYSPHVLFSPSFNSSHLSYLRVKESEPHIEKYGTDSTKVQYYRKMISAKLRCVDSIKNVYDWLFLSTYDSEYDHYYYESSDETTRFDYMRYYSKLLHYPFEVEANMFVSSQIKKKPYYDKIEEKWVISFKKKMHTYTALEIYWLYEISTDMVDKIEMSSKEAKLVFDKLEKTKFFPLTKVSQEIARNYQLE